MYTSKKRKTFSGFTGSHLKWIALITMCIDHIGAILLESGLLPLISSAVLAGHSFEYLPADYEFWYGLNSVLRLIGRVSFPLYCFLLVEGFLHTKSIARYALRLGLFALLSEVPFDLALYGTPFDLHMQNVFFTLFFGLLVLWGMKRTEERAGRPTFLTYGVAFFGMLAAYFLQTDYDAFGILLIAMLYLLRSDRKWLCIFGCCATLWERTAPLAFLPIWFYTGERGKQFPKYFFYAFYPLHLILLAGLRLLLF